MRELGSIPSPQAPRESRGGNFQHDRKIPFSLYYNVIFPLSELVILMLLTSTQAIYQDKAEACFLFTSEAYARIQ
jgi:hypothetical protein